MRPDTDRVHTPRRVLAGFVVTLAWEIFVVAVMVRTYSVALFVALQVLYVVAALVYGTWRGWRTSTAAGVQKRLRRPGDEVRVRIGYQGASVRIWDPSRPFGPGNGVRGAGYGSYRLNESEQITLTWHPVGGRVQVLTGPRVELVPIAARVRARRLLITMIVLYAAVLAAAGLTVGLFTDNLGLGLAAVGIAVCVLPLFAAARRTKHAGAASQQRQQSS
jgi:hypothetical protein